jgi:hypothetical protein
MPPQWFDELSFPPRMSGRSVVFRQEANGELSPSFLLFASVPCRDPTAQRISPFPVFRRAIGFRPIATSVFVEGDLMAKECPISRASFHEKAKPVKVQVGDNTLTAEVREFSTGSFGWYVNGKATIDIDGVSVPVQVGMNLTVIGSKDTPR